jgi:hypothetical protein
MSNEPYLKKTTVEDVWNPEYDQNAFCKCGHHYHRHFDSYEEMANVGCKYCGCYNFTLASPEKIKLLQQAQDTTSPEHWKAKYMLQIERAEGLRIELEKIAWMDEFTDGPLGAKAMMNIAREAINKDR